MSIDFRECLAALSDVIINRPVPLRLFDQIYMKIPDILLHAELIGRWFDGRRVAFIGDGDAVALAMVHLSERRLIPGERSHVVVFDFDERQVNSINQFASRHQLASRIRAELYNVADRLPEVHWNVFDAFHTNPPWGASNGGSSVRAFVRRGIECCHGSSVGCIVIADQPSLPWAEEVSIETQRLVIKHGFRVAEMVPQFHSYHLDDNPGLKSCALIVTRGAVGEAPITSVALEEDERRNFYGRDNPLQIHYIRDLTAGGKSPSNDHHAEPLKKGS